MRSATPTAVLAGQCQREREGKGSAAHGPLLSPASGAKSGRGAAGELSPGTISRAGQQALASPVDTCGIQNVGNSPSVFQRCGQPQIGQVPTEALLSICEL